MTGKSIYDVSDSRVLLLDGGFGTMAMNGFTADEIHEAYLRAGADIIETDIAASSHDGAAEAARTARAAAERHTAMNPGRPRFAFGAVYPSGSNVPEHVEGLLDGGIDGIIFETATSVKALVGSLETLASITARRGIRVPVMVSATLTRESVLPSGETIADFYSAVRGFEPLAAGFNCSFGPESLLKPLEELAGMSDMHIVAYPSAGLPDRDGRYPVTPAAFVAVVSEYLERGLADCVGGCCGTTPEYISALNGIVGRYTPRTMTKNKKRDL